MQRGTKARAAELVSRKNDDAAYELDLTGGRHSVASQAVTGGESIKAVRAQLGHISEQSTHKYAHLGSGAQLRLVTALKPARAPHDDEPPREAHVNRMSTAAPSAVGSRS